MFLIICDKMSEYPKEFIRGITSPNHVVAPTLITADVFTFQQNHKREDGIIEESINWNDDGDAIDFTLQQKREDENYQFRGGVAVVPKEDVDRLMRKPITEDCLNYERLPLKTNKYHGNLLLDDKISKKSKQLLVTSLVVAVERIIPNRYCE